MTYYTKEQIKSANAGDIVTYAKYAGIALKNDSRNTLKGVEHDSLVIDISKNMWFWNSRSLHGKGALSFAIQCQNLSFMDAMQAVLKSGACTVEHKEYKPEPQKPFVFNQKQLNKDCNRAYKYLHKERGISKTTFDYLYNLGLIRQDIYGNVLFIWRGIDDNKIKGATRQGTTNDKSRFGKHGAIKRVVKNSTHDYGFWFDTPNSNHIEKIRFFESPIDAISYYELSRIKNNMQNTRFISIDGLHKGVIINMTLLTTKQQHTKPEIGLAVDNDKAGKIFLNKMQNYFGNILNCTPTETYGKDWNDTLKGIEKKILSKG